MGLLWTAWRPYKLSKINALCINWSYSPKDQFLKFWQKLLSFWWWLKNSVFLSRQFWKKNCQKKLFFFSIFFSIWPTQKNWVFKPPPKAEQFLPKCHGLVLGLVELIDANGIDMVVGCLTYAQKWPKNTKNAFFACFWAYVGEPHNHIDWATSMPFASINSTNPRTNPWNFGGNCSAFGGGWKTQFFWVGHFEIFFAKKKKKFASFPWKLVNIYRVARSFRNFDDYPGFQKVTG